MGEVPLALIIPSARQVVEGFHIINRSLIGSQRLIKMTEEISFQIELPISFEDAYNQVTAALKAEGFGVLTEIDVKATLKKKIDVDFRPYIILGACNPSLAHKALENEPLVGLMLPCNVTIEETKKGSLVNLINPKTMILANPLLAQNDELKEVAEDAFIRLSRVAKALEIHQ